MATADWSRKTSEVPEGARRQWRADRALRPPMLSPGRPEPSRAVQRQFWRLIATGITSAEAALKVGVGRLLAVADAAGMVDWSVSVDSTIARAHQHATNITRTTGGSVELHDSGARAA